MVSALHIFQLELHVYVSLLRQVLDDPLILISLIWLSSYLVKTTNYEGLVMHFSSALCYCRFGPNILLSITFANTLSLCSFSDSAETVSPSYGTTGWGFFFSSMLCCLVWYLVIKVLRLHIGAIFKGQALKMVPVGCPETLVTRYKPAVCNSPEEQRPQQHCSGSMKSCRRLL